MVGNGTHIHLTLPEEMIGTPFRPWQEEAVPEVLHSCQDGDYYLEALDVFKNRKFIRTEYDSR